MANKVVLVHRCKHADMDDGSPLQCSCKMRVSRTQANRKIDDGSAVWKKAPLGALDYDQIILWGRQPRVPRAPTIAKSHIERAFIYKKGFEQDRIESYGEATQRALIELAGFWRQSQSRSTPTAPLRCADHARDLRACNRRRAPASG
jgi:hypothetical protein